MSDLWVFGYGSLMWRPGFSFVEAIPARLHGEHRSLCVLSFVHRGTPENPGLVLGLDKGGSCRGVAFRIEPAAIRDAIAYLRERELVTHVYREVERFVGLENDPRGSVRATAFVVDREHPQYAGKLEAAAVLERVRHARGISGDNRDYVIATARHLQGAGIADPLLAWLAAELERSPALNPPP